MVIVVSFFSLFESQIKVVLKCYSRYCNNHYDFSDNNRNALRHSNLSAMRSRSTMIYEFLYVPGY